MSNLKITSLLITRTSIRSAKMLEESHIQLVFYRFFGGSFIESIEYNHQDPYNAFPIHIEFKDVEIDGDLTKYNIDKIYEFNRILQEKIIAKLYVGDNEFWSLCCLDMKHDSPYKSMNSFNDIHFIETPEDSDSLLRDKVKTEVRNIHFSSEIDVQMNLLNTFIHMTQNKTKFEIAEMMGGILDEDDYFVHNNKKTLNQYEKYLKRKYRLTHLSPTIISDIIKNTKMLCKKEQIEHEADVNVSTIKLQRQCTEPETFERVHGIPFEDADVIFRDKR